MSPGKAFTDPLLIALVISTIAIALALRSRKQRRPLYLALTALLCLALFSTGFTTHLLERSLETSLPPGNPEVIVVASGGSFPDALSESSARRIITGVAWWKQHPRTRLVICGADVRGSRRTIRTLKLMREEAIRRGVPASAIVLETWSTNTREHPLGVLELPGINKDTRIGLVTSTWHMRRALAAFGRHFPHVVARAGDQPERRPNDFFDFVPSSFALRDSTRLLHEWIGIAWYALRR